MANLNERVHKYLDTLKVSNTECAKKDIIPVVDQLRGTIAQLDPRFRTSLECRGSIYEKAKIHSADEFDYDLPIKALDMERAPTDVPRGFSEGTSLSIPILLLFPTLLFADDLNKALASKKT